MKMEKVSVPKGQNARASGHSPKSKKRLVKPSLKSVTRLTLKHDSEINLDELSESNGKIRTAGRSPANAGPYKAAERYKRRWDTKSRDLWIEDYLPLVKSIVSRMRHHFPESQMEDIRDWGSGTCGCCK